jgi:DNA polymerase
VTDDRRELVTLIEATRAQIEWWRETGIETIARSDALVEAKATADCEALPGSDTIAASPTPELFTSPPAPTPTADDYLTHPGVREARSLAELRAVIGDCQRCKLAPHRTQIVFGVGNPDADLVFVGEAPGRDEDLRGEPFVGRAGQLLTEIITKGMKLRRTDVYIANIIKCRPPQNRNPEPDEIAACEPFLKQQLALLKPKAIVALGTFAAQCLLKTRTPITRLRGVWANYQGIPLMPTFHPAYLLRNPGDKRLVWRDIQQVMALLGLR